MSTHISITWYFQSHNFNPITFIAQIYKRTFFFSIVFTPPALIYWISSLSDTNIWWRIEFFQLPMAFFLSAVCTSLWNGFRHSRRRVCVCALNVFWWYNFTQRVYVTTQTLSFALNGRYYMYWFKFLLMLIKNSLSNRLLFCCRFRLQCAQNVFDSDVAWFVIFLLLFYFFSFAVGAKFKLDLFNLKMSYRINQMKIKIRVTVNVRVDPFSDRPFFNWRE